MDGLLNLFCIKADTLYVVPAGRTIYIARKLPDIREEGEDGSDSNMLDGSGLRFKEHVVYFVWPREVER